MKQLSICALLFLPACALLFLPACRGVLEDTPKTQDSDTSVELNDADGDGFSAEEDCDDSDSGVHPDARELCDGLDNDCDGLIDDEDNNVYGTDVWYLDADADGYGQDILAVEACEAPDSYVDLRGDCNDLDPLLHTYDLDGDGQSSCEGDCEDQNPNIYFV